MHLAVDGYGADPRKLQDADLLRNFLDSYPASLGMTKVSEPMVLTYRGPTPEDWGLSGFVIIAESHISIHTFPDRSYVNVDIFSCKEFDTEFALKQVTELFGIEHAKMWRLERGLEHLLPYPGVNPTPSASR
ncbi:MAG: S-adenosylmethionine decarboxylase [Chloroflexota bacterium]|nr:S-adenosylmethionine decarboxylase [Chloroflexota bacterium]